MKFGILGTGIVGRTLATKLAECNHEVMIGTRDVAATLTRLKPDVWRNQPFQDWKKEHGEIQLGTFAQTAAHGDILLNATAGSVSLDVLQTMNVDDLTGKILIDTANPLDFSQGFPPLLSVVNTDSLGEQIQRTFPTMKVVKALNTVVVELMVNPKRLADGEHHLLVCGNDTQAKAVVMDLLTNEFGWKGVIDLGDIAASRGMEMLLPVNFRLWHVLQTRTINFKIVQ